jgi:tetratricopeptide (TPR) repeat protein
MVSLIKETNLEEVKQKLSSMTTDLNKLSYIEIAIKEPSFSFEIKRYLLENASKMYENRKMYEKAAKAIANKASMDVSSKERVESYLKAAELYSKIGKVELADDIFVRASRETNNYNEKAKIELAQKNIYTQIADNLERLGKKAVALKFYERLIKMHIEPLEKEIIKQKLSNIYKSLGMFKESKLILGI